MDQVKGSTVFSKFDMKLGYNQLRIKSDHKWLTAFNTHRGPHKLNVMTFGFMNAPPAFQRFSDDHIYRKPEIVNNTLGSLMTETSTTKTWRNMYPRYASSSKGAERPRLPSTQRSVNFTWTKSNF